MATATGVMNLDMVEGTVIDGFLRVFARSPYPDGCGGDHLYLEEIPLRLTYADIHASAPETT